MISIDFEVNGQQCGSMGKVLLLCKKSFFSMINQSMFGCLANYEDLESYFS